MNEVRLSTEKYDALQQSIQAKAAKIDALETEIAKLKSEHEAEIERLAKEGKVRVIEKPCTVMEILKIRCKPKTKYKGFDDVKAEVEEHFKQGLFDEELEKHKQEQLDCLVKQLAEKETAIDELRADNKRLYNRSLWERIRNK
jgi:hypothetical protein